MDAAKTSDPARPSSSSVIARLTQAIRTLDDGEWDTVAFEELAVLLRDCLTLLSSQEAAGPHLQTLYNELLYEVVSKYPGESRHDTARRYIRERGTPSSQAASAALTASRTPDE